jgi:hypothetical protein
VEKVKVLPETTPDVVQWLRGLGLVVTEKQITNDTVDRFLPPRPVETAPTGRGRAGVWKPWMVRRAERLYRLRRRKDESGLPMVYGDTLRILLFIRDGWGWSRGIRDLCLQGYEKGVKATLKPVRQYVRGPADREKVEFALEAHDAKLVPAERFAAGVAAYGRPLEGGSLRGIFKGAQLFGLVDLPPEFVKLFEPLGMHDSLDIASYIGSAFARGSKILKTMFQTASDRDAYYGVPAFVAFITRLRRGIHRAAITDGRKNFPSNPLTFFGRTQRELERVFREMKAPERATPAQFLALLIGLAMAGNYVLRLGERLATYALSVAQKVFGMKPPGNDEQIIPFAVDVMKRVFRVNLVPQEATTE